MSMSLSLGLGLGMGGGGSPQPPQLPGDLLCQAIAAKVCVTATHKGKSLKLAPHVVYTHGGQSVPTLDAVTVESDGNAPNKPKISSFVVADLAGLAATADPFTLNPGFDPADSKYAGKTVCII